MPAHFAYPLRLEAGRFVTVEQDTTEEVEGAVEAILRCPLGHLDSDPDMGLPDLAFGQGAPDAGVVRDSIERNEPRVEALTDSTLDGLTARVTVEVRNRG